MARLKKNINLLPKSSGGKTPGERLLQWLLTIGRYLILSTEMITIIIFLFRFKLDEDLRSLNKKILYNQSIVESYQDLENKTVFLQNQLEAIKETQKNSLLSSLILQEVSRSIPADMLFTEIEINHNTIRMEGSCFSSLGLNAFLSQIQKSPYFSEINLETISTKGKSDPTLNFKISAKLLKIN